MPPTASPSVRYGGLHQAEKRKWIPVIQAGQGWCHAIRCLEPSRHIPPGTPLSMWHLGHTPDGTTWTGPEHRRCNCSEGATRGNRMRRRRRRPRRPNHRWVL